MIVHKVKQGSPEWFALHCGRPSASRFTDILTPKTRKPSASADRYMLDILVGYFLGSPPDTTSSGFMDRGLALEGEGRSFYEFQRNVDVEQVGFVTPDHGRWGASPDGLVGDDGMLEVKCLSAREHVAALLDKAETYELQIQGQMMVCERQWSDRLYYSPCFPPLIQRVERDDDLIALLTEHLVAFCDKLDDAKAKLVGMGCEPYHPPSEEDRERVRMDFEEFDRLVAERATA